MKVGDHVTVNERVESGRAHWSGVITRIPRSGSMSTVDGKDVQNRDIRFHSRPTLDHERSWIYLARLAQLARAGKIAVDQVEATPLGGRTVVFLRKVDNGLQLTYDESDRASAFEVAESLSVAWAEVAAENK